MFYIGVTLFYYRGGFYVFKIAAPKNIPTNFILQVPLALRPPPITGAVTKTAKKTSLVMANAFLTGNRENELTASSTQEAINIIKKMGASQFGL